MANRFPQLVNTETFTWTTLSTGGLSDVHDLRTSYLSRLVNESTVVTGTIFTFLESETSGGTFMPLYDDAGTEYQVTMAHSRRISISPTDLIGGCYVKIRTGTSTAVSVQTTDLTVTAVVRPL